MFMMLDVDKEKCFWIYIEKGVEMYEVMRDKYLIILDELWKCVDNGIKIVLNIKEQCDILNIRNEILRYFDGFCIVVEEIKDFYIRMNIEKIKNDLDELEVIFLEYYKVVKDVYIQIEFIEQKFVVFIFDEVK